MNETTDDSKKKREDDRTSVDPKQGDNYPEDDVERRLKIESDYCPMEGKYVCPCARVNRLMEIQDAIIQNGNLMLDFLKALVQTTDAELIDTLPRKIEEVQAICQSHF